MEDGTITSRKRVETSAVMVQLLLIALYLLKFRRTCVVFLNCFSCNLWQSFLRNIIVTCLTKWLLSCSYDFKSFHVFLLLFYFHAFDVFFLVFPPRKFAKIGENPAHTFIIITEQSLHYLLHQRRALYCEWFGESCKLRLEHLIQLTESVK